MPSRLRFHGYHRNGEDICEFLEAIEDCFDDRFDDCYSGREQSTQLAAYLLNHLRGCASRFAEGLPKSVCHRWSKLSSALEEKFDVYYPPVNLYHGQYDTESEYKDDDFEEASKPHPIRLILPPEVTIERFTLFMRNYYIFPPIPVTEIIASLPMTQEQLNEAVMDCWKAKIASENATRMNPETPVFNLTLLESEMSELLLTMNEMTKVLLSVLLVLRLVCRMIDEITRINDEIKFWKDERTEQASIDQLSNELVKIDMEVVEISMGISESKPSDMARVRLSEGMVRSSRFFSSLRKGSAVVLEDCFIDNKVGSRSDVFVAYVIDFLGAMKRAGIG